MRVGGALCVQFGAGLLYPVAGLGGQLVGGFVGAGDGVAYLEVDGAGFFGEAAGWPVLACVVGDGDDGQLGLDSEEGGGGVIVAGAAGAFGEDHYPAVLEQALFAPG